MDEAPIEESKVIESTLQNPFFLYPNYPVSGYHNITLYNDNLQILKRDMIILTAKIKKPTLLHFSFGAAMEECDDSALDFQWRQLFPYHLETAAKEHPTLEIIHIIISPNETFEFGDRQKCPRFVEKSDIKFTYDKSTNTIVAKEFNITTHIYCTMMPTVELNNKKRIDSLLMLEFPDYYNIRGMRQTANDISFVNKFYSTMDKLMQRVELMGGCTTGFSFAVFNEMTDPRKACIKDYAMFKEVKILFENNEKSQLCEWKFQVGSYCLVPYMRKNLISYIKPDKASLHGDQIILTRAPSSSFSYILSYVPSATIYKNHISKVGHSRLVDLDSLYEAVLTVFEATDVSQSVMSLREKVSRNLQCTNYADAVCKYSHLKEFKLIISDYAKKHPIFNSLYPEIVKHGKNIAPFLELNGLPLSLIIGGELELQAIANVMKIDITVHYIDSINDTEIDIKCRKKIHKINDCDVKYIKSTHVDLYYKNGVYSAI